MWHNRRMPEDDVQWLIKNEYASVKVTVDTEGKGTRLKVEDLSSGTVIYLDPLELQALAWATREDLSAFTRPYFKERALERKMGIVRPDAGLDEAESIVREEESDSESNP
jgi:hypothetical protein